MTVAGHAAADETWPSDIIHRAVGLACRAPSVHNTQPWRWRIEGRYVELRADRERQLEVSDPVGRNLTISCGAALHHLQVASAGSGLGTVVHRFPDPEARDLLAVVEMTEGKASNPENAELLDALERRQTDRRRFTSWPVPDERLSHLASLTERWGTRVFPLTGSSARATVERLVDRAIEVQEGDPHLVDEQRRWIDHSSADGVPAASLPPQEHPAERRDRFNRGAGTTRPRGSLESTDGVLAICTSKDDPAGWLDAGETLSALWLRATRAGLSLVPLSQVVEVQETRSRLRHDVFFDMAHPQLLVRIGWQEVARSPLPRSPRRPLDDVVIP